MSRSFSLLDRADGASLAELLTVVSISMAMGAVAVPMWMSGLEGLRVSGAARYFASRLALARMEAIKRSTTVAVRFEGEGSATGFRLYVDGNRNGVRTAEITSGIDWPLGPLDRLGDHFRQAVFGAAPHVPGIEDGDEAPGDDPIRFGRSSILSYTPDGTATSGTAYIRGRGSAQFAVRVLGATARTRLLEYRASDRRWTER